MVTMIDMQWPVIVDAILGALRQNQHGCQAGVWRSLFTANPPPQTNITHILLLCTRLEETSGHALE